MNNHYTNMNISIELLVPLAKYLAWFSICYAIVLFFLMVVVVIFVAPFKAFKALPNGKTPNWPMIPILYAFVIAGLLSYYILEAYFQMQPPTLIDNSQSVASQLNKINSQARTIQEKFTNPKSLTISQLEEALSTAVHVTKDLSDLTGVQQQQIKKLQSSVIIEQQKAEEAKQLARDIQSLTKNQIDAVKLLITKDANEASDRSFIIGIIVSFPLGILSSFLATWIFRRFGREKQKELLINMGNLAHHVIPSNAQQSTPEGRSAGKPTPRP